MGNLLRELITACNSVEADIRANERRLEMFNAVHEELQRKIIKLLERDDIDNDEKINTLKSYFMIKN